MLLAEFCTGSCVDSRSIGPDLGRIAMILYKYVNSCSHALLIVRPNQLLGPVGTGDKVVKV
jgi:hypothetical protein